MNVIDVLAILPYYLSLIFMEEVKFRKYLLFDAPKIRKYFLQKASKSRKYLLHQAPKFMKHLLHEEAPKSRKFLLHKDPKISKYFLQETPKSRKSAIQIWAGVRQFKFIKFGPGSMFYRLNKKWINSCYFVNALFFLLKSLNS